MNGEEFKEDGKFKTVSGMDVIVTKGSYTIVEKDGSITVVNYTADEHGFHPEISEFHIMNTKIKCLCSDVCVFEYYFSYTSTTSR